MRKHGLAIILPMILLAAAMIPGAFAENQLPGLVDATAALAFNTENVTIKAEADFSLDGVLFKHFSGTQIQVGKDAYRDILLTTPQDDGSEKETGYIILVNGSEKMTYNRYLKQAGIYHNITHRSSILRRSAEAENTAAICRSMAAYAETVLPADTVTQQDHTLTIVMDDFQELSSVNAVLTMLLQRFGTYRDYVDYRQVTSNPEAFDFSEYSTTTQGILYCTTGVKLKHLEMTIELDDEQRLTAVNGAADLILCTRNGGEHLLTVSFCASIADYGTSTLPENPIPMEDMLAGQNSNIVNALTEIYGYSWEEAKEFIVDVDGMTIVCYPADYPDWRYEMRGWQLYTPFATNYENYPGEGCVRGFLTLAHKNNWLSSASVRNKTVIQTWLNSLNITPNEELNDYLKHDAEYSAEQFIRAFFRSCYGPEDTWPDRLDQWQDQEIAYWRSVVAATADMGVSPTSLVYYNPNGGSKYHADMNCPSVSEKYLPLTGFCSLDELSTGEYAYLLPCSICAAPIVE